MPEMRGVKCFREISLFTFVPFDVEQANSAGWHMAEERRYISRGCATPPTSRRRRPSQGRRHDFESGGIFWPHAQPKIQYTQWYKKRNYLLLFNDV